MEMAQQILDALLGDTPVERVMIAGLAFWVAWLQWQLARVQEKRVEGAMRIANAAHTFANALERNTETLRMLGEG